MGYLIFTLFAVLLLATIGITLLWPLSAMCRFLALLIKEFAPPPKER